jgi:hypothetical protein
MKRPYRVGDLFAVPMPDGAAASGVVVAMAGRAPLLAFFDSNDEPALVARVDDRALAVLRWPIVGRRADRIDPALTSNRIEASEIVELQVQALRAGVRWERPRVVVRDLRMPFREEALVDFPDDAWIQWREVLGKEDRRRVADWLAAHPRVGVRIYGKAAHGDRAVFESFPLLKRAAMQVSDDAMSAFESLAHLRVLRLEGVPNDLPAIRHTSIECVRIVGRADETILGCDLLDAENLKSAEFFGVRIEDAQALGRMPNLRALRLTRTPGVKSLAWLASSNVTHLILEGLTHVDDLSPLAEMSALQHLTLRGMWQFGVDQYDWIDRCPRLRGLSIDAGARRKTIEIYRERRFAAASPYVK